MGIQYAAKTTPHLNGVPFNSTPAHSQLSRFHCFFAHQLPFQSETCRGNISKQSPLPYQLYVWPTVSRDKGPGFFFFSRCSIPPPSFSPSSSGNG